MDSRVVLNALKLSKPTLKGHPIVYVDEKRGPDYAHEWRATCHLGGYSRLGSHWHTNKHDARQDAASNMIMYIDTGGGPKAQSDSMDDITFTENNPSSFTAPSDIGHQPLNSRNSSPKVAGERHLLPDIRPKKPLARFLNTHYLRAQRILYLADEVIAFHMQIYHIARQGLTLVVLLNDTIEHGPSEMGLDEAIDLSDELIELEKDIPKWAKTPPGFNYGKGQAEIEEWYRRLFRERSYFHNADPSDEIYERLQAYDKRTRENESNGDRDIYINEPHHGPFVQGGDDNRSSRPSTDRDAFSSMSLLSAQDLRVPVAAIEDLVHTGVTSHPAGTMAKPLSTSLAPMQAMATFAQKHLEYGITYSLESHGPDHEKSHQAIYKMGDRIIGEGESMTSKRGAKHSAAERAVSILEAEGHKVIAPRVERVASAKDSST